MRYALLGESGLVVSKLALGAMTFGTSRFPIKTIDARAAAELTAIALDHGVNFFDTADVYALGESETMLGEALGKRRKDVVISTKVGGRMGEALNDAGLSRRHILQSVDASLKRLNTEWIDLYIVHRADALTPLDETLDALDHVVRMGKVRYLGFSNWPAWKAAKALALQRERGLARFVAGQVYYSLAHRDIEREIVPLSLDQGVGLMIWSPLARGLLSGRYDREHPLSGESLFARSGANIERAYDIVPVLRKIARAHNTNAAAVALAWIAARPAIATVIMGASSSDQLKENLAAASFELTAAEHAELNEASKLPPEYPGWFIDFAVDAPLKEALGL